MQTVTRRDVLESLVRGRPQAPSEVAQMLAWRGVIDPPVDVYCPIVERHLRGLERTGWAVRRCGGYEPTRTAREVARASL
jgi:hypothetical protein